MQTLCLIPATMHDRGAAAPNTQCPQSDIQVRIFSHTKHHGNVRSIVYTSAPDLAEESALA